MRRWLVGSLAMTIGLMPVAPIAAQDAEVDRELAERVAPYQGDGDAGGFHSILPPGQDGVLNLVETLEAQAGDPPEHFDDQLGPYEALVFEDATPGFGDEGLEADLETYFKDGSFGVKPDEVERTYRPDERDDVVVVRDDDGVAHVRGETREGAMFANGYTAAEDRLFVMDALRNIGRANLSAFLGPSEANLAQDAEQFAAAPYTEQDLTDQVDSLRLSDDPLERRVHEDGLAYIDGVNTYIEEALSDPRKLPAEYVALQRTPERFVPEDIVATAALVGGIFGKGGGREVANYCGLEQLEGELGEQRAREVFDDFKFADDPEAPRTVEQGSFPYLSDLGPVDADAVPDLDCSSLSPIEAPDPGTDDVVDALGDEVPRLPVVPDSLNDLLDQTQTTLADVTPEAPLAPAGEVSQDQTIDLGPLGEIPFATDRDASNALLVGAEHTETGNPLAVFGPQTGYFAPQLLSEKDVQAPGLSARGVAFAGTDLYVQLGRGGDYAWSATSAGSDIVDQVVLRLCEPDGGEPDRDSMGYERRSSATPGGADGQCREISEHQTVRLAKPSAGGVPEEPDVLINRYFERSEDYGPLVARGTLEDGTPIAIASNRSTYGAELESAVGFSQINDPEHMEAGVDGFREAMGGGIDYTFNWFYVDEESISYQHSCKCPVREPGTDPYLPHFGDGTADWDGFVPFDEQPHVTDPDSGSLISWNNKQARDWWSSDGEFAYGPIHRSDLLQSRLDDQLEAGGGEVGVGEAVDVMALAATTDLRGQELVGLIQRVLDAERPAGLDPRAERVVELLGEWTDQGAHRRDHDDDGSYEHATAIAVMDALWQPLVDAIFEDGTADAREVLGLTLHNTTMSGLGSAFNDGLYAHVHKDLRQALGVDVQAPFSTTYCGDGVLDDCALDLWGAVEATLVDLEEKFDSAEVDDWRRARGDDAIVHTPVGVTGVADTHWQNRPTFQQVVSIPTGDDEGATDDDTDEPGRPDAAGPPDDAGPPDQGGPPDDAGPGPESGPAGEAGDGGGDGRQSDGGADGDGGGPSVPAGDVLAEPASATGDGLPDTDTPATGGAGAIGALGAALVLAVSLRQPARDPR